MEVFPSTVFCVSAFLIVPLDISFVINFLWNLQRRRSQGGLGPGIPCGKFHGHCNRLHHCSCLFSAKLISLSLSIMPRPVQLASVRYVSSTHVRFRREGAARDGISLSEAMAGVRLTEDGSHTPTDLNVRDGGIIVLKIKAGVFQSIYMLSRSPLIPTTVVRV